jgi:hypothetical protein
LRAGHIRQHRKKHQSQIQTSETLNSLSPFILHPFALILSRNLSFIPLPLSFYDFILHELRQYGVGASASRSQY